MLVGYRGRKVQQQQMLLVCKSVSYVCIRDDAEEQTSVCGFGK